VEMFRLHLVSSLGFMVVLPQSSSVGASGRESRGASTEFNLRETELRCSAANRVKSIFKRNVENENEEKSSRPRVDLGVAASFSRPRVSNDNPFSQFKTLKHPPEFLERFDGLEHARARLRGFFAWYRAALWESLTVTRSRLAVGQLFQAAGASTGEAGGSVHAVKPPEPGLSKLNSGCMQQRRR